MVSRPARSGAARAAPPPSLAPTLAGSASEAAGRPAGSLNALGVQIVRFGSGTGFCRFLAARMGHQEVEAVRTALEEHHHHRLPRKERVEAAQVSPPSITPSL